MTAVEFKIVDAADQRFSAFLGDRRVTVRLRYNPTIDRWSLNLAIDDLPVLHGRRVVTGVDLLRAYNFGIGIMFAQEEKAGTFLPPGKRELVGGLVKLCHALESDVEEALASV